MAQTVIEFTFCGTPVALCRVAAPVSTSSLQECTDEHMEIGPDRTWRLCICQSAPPQTDEGSDYFVVYHREIRDWGSRTVEKPRE